MSALPYQVDEARVVRRDELRDFLRSRRARLTPKDVGIPVGGRRRTPGLRREEVAFLAGIGVSWYTYLEQGRDITVTPQVLDGISSALRLDGQERAHLYRLAGHFPPETIAGPEDPLPEAVHHLLDEWNPNPAYVLDRYWRLIAGNRTLHLLFDGVRRGDSCLDGFDGSSGVRRLISNWSEVSEHLVAGLRAQAARFPQDVEFDRIVSRLQTTSADFSAVWARQDVGNEAFGPKVVNHPHLGALSFTRASLHAVGASENRIVLLLPTLETRARIAGLIG